MNPWAFPQACRKKPEEKRDLLANIIDKINLI
jgi:hypothetical protein